MKIRAFHIYFVLIFVSLGLFLSCSDDNSEALLGRLSISVKDDDSSKALKVEGGGILSVSSFEYFAIPQFDGMRIIGQAGSENPDGTYLYVPLSGFNSGETKTIGPFTQGLWLFGIKALDATGNLIAQSKPVKTYINASENNMLVFTLNTVSEGSGNVIMEISANKVSENGGMLKVEYCKIANGIAGAYIQVPETSITSISTSETSSFSLDFEDLISGLYFVRIGYYDEVLIGGETVAFMVNEDKTVSISGKIENGVYAYAGIKVKNIVGIIGTLSCDNIISGVCPAGSDMKFIWTPGSESAEITGYSWFINGQSSLYHSDLYEANVNGSTLNLKVLKEGFYSVEVAVFGENEQMGNGILEFSTL